MFQWDESDKMTSTLINTHNTAQLTPKKKKQTFQVIRRKSNRTWAVMHPETKPYTMSAIILIKLWGGVAKIQNKHEQK